LGGPDQVSPRASTVGTIPDMIRQVSHNIVAIGFETLYILKLHEDKGGLKTLRIDGNKAENINILLSSDKQIYIIYSLFTRTNSKKHNT